MKFLWWTCFSLALGISQSAVCWRPSGTPRRLGVVASKNFLPGDVVERCYCLPVKKSHILPSARLLSDYLFVGASAVLFPFGWALLYNRATKPGMVPATAAGLITPEERAAMRIQSLARGRHARKKVKVPAPFKKVKQVEPITTAELWEGLAFDSGKMRSKIDVYELVSGFSGCKRTGLATSVELLARDDVQTSEADAFAVGELLLEEVNHLALVICSRREPLIETEAKEELLRIKEFVRDCGMAIRSEEKMSSRHFKNWIRLLATLMSMDLSVILFQWYWFEFGLFLPTAEVLEVLLMATVYSESRRTALAAKLGDGKLVNVPFVLRDLMQLVYNGGLCGRTDCACLMPSEVQALWPYILRHMPHHLKVRRTLRSSVATGTLRKALLHGTALGEADHSEPRKDLDMEKSHIAGVEEFSILLELLYDDDRMKSRFSSPLEMLVDMVKHATEYGRLWDDTEAT